MLPTVFGTCGRNRRLGSGLDVLFFSRALVVDACAGSAACCAQLLRGRGCHARTLSSARNLLEQAVQFAPDLILLDMATMVAAGVGVVRSLRANPTLESMWIVAIDERRGRQGVPDARAAGFDGQLVRPLDSHTLDAILAAVRSRVRRRDGATGARHGTAFTGVEFGRYRFPVIWGGLMLVINSRPIVRMTTKEWT